MALPAVACAPGTGDHKAAQGWEWGHGGRVSRPNPAVEPTPNSFRSYVASAIGRGSPPAFGLNKRNRAMQICVEIAQTKIA